MNNMTRLLLMNNGKDKEGRRRRMGVEYEDWTPTSHYGPYMPTTYDDRPMEPKSAFYDRRGHRHYDNGRFAPMGTYGDPMDTYVEPMGDYREPESRRYRRYSDGRFAPRNNYPSMPTDNWGEDRDRRMELEPMRSGYGPRMIGFSREWDTENMRSDATMPRYTEMEHMQGQRGQRGGAYSDEIQPMDQKMAIDWTNDMKNADGTTGPHWNPDQCKQVQAQRNIEADPWEFYVALNMMYSDYCKIFRKFGVGDKIEFYADMAKAFIDDSDAQPGKLARYYNSIVKR